MSGGINVKSAPRAPASSGIPLPHSLLTSSPKAEARRRGSELPRPTSQTPKHTPTHTPTHSPSLSPRRTSIPGPRAQNLTRDAPPKGHLFKRTGALPAPQVSRSAYSSPLTQRRLLPPHSKDTLDLGKTPLAPSYFPHDGNCNRNTFTNKNQTCDTSNLRPPPLLFRRAENSNASEDVSQRGAPENHPVPLNNSNLRPLPVQNSYSDATRGQSESASQSDEEMDSPEDSSPISSPGVVPLPPIVFTLPKMAVSTLDESTVKEAACTETHSPKVNMATVAPFSYRQVVTHPHTHTLCVFWRGADCVFFTFSLLTLYIVLSYTQTVVWEKNKERVNLIFRVKKKLCVRCCV